MCWRERSPRAPSTSTGAPTRPRRTSWTPRSNAARLFRRRSTRSNRPLRPKILVRETIADAGVELLRAKFDVDVDAESPLAEIIGRYDALIVRSATKVDAELIAAAKR